MRQRIPILAVFALAVFLAPAVWAQEAQERYEPDRIPVELRETVYFEGDVTFPTANGERTVHVVLKQLQLDGGAEVALPLPERGVAVLQHRAGEVALGTGERRVEPLEGEWMTIDLPAQVTLATEDDAALVDAIVVEE